MEKKSFFTMLAMLTLGIFIGACEKDTTDPIVEPPDNAGYLSITSLSHYIDTSQKVSVSDQMLSKLRVDSTQNNFAVKTLADKNCISLMQASSSLLLTDYTINTALLDIVPSSTLISETKENNANDKYNKGIIATQTIYQTYPDKQILTIIVKISRFWLEINGYKFWFPSMKLESCNFIYLRNTAIAATRGVGDKYLLNAYSAEYKNELVFVSTNTTNPQRITVPIYAYAKRNTLDAEEESIELSCTAKNKKWISIDSLSSQISFDRVSVLENGDTVKKQKTLILHHWIKGGNVKSKTVGSLIYEQPEIGIVNNGKAIPEPIRSVDDGKGVWKVYGAYGSYTNTLYNGNVQDTIQTHYDFYLEWATYTEEENDINVRFPRQAMGFADDKISMQEESSDRSGYKKTVLDNSVKATYLAVPQVMSQRVYLYSLY